MLGQKPVSLFTLVSQHNDDMKFIDTEVSSVFTREVRWTQVHAGYTRSLLWDFVMVTCLPCPSCCSSIASSSQQHSAGIQWKENQVWRKHRLLGLLDLLCLCFCLSKSQSAPRQLSPCLLTSPHPPRRG